MKLCRVSTRRAGSTRQFREESVSPSPSFYVVKNALKLALLEEATAGDGVRAARGSKLLVMLPRMLLRRPPGRGKIAKSTLVARFVSFSQGDWSQLIAASEDCDERSVASR